jgi:hypothetical protein
LAEGEVLDSIGLIGEDEGVEEVVGLGFTKKEGGDEKSYPPSDEVFLGADGFAGKEDGAVGMTGKEDGAVGMTGTDDGAVGMTGTDDGAVGITGKEDGAVGLIGKEDGRS